MTDVADSIDRVSRFENSVTRFVVELAIALAGTVCMGIAIGANQQWLDRHFLPSFLLPREWYVLLQTAARVVLSAFGAWLAFIVRPRAGRGAERAPGYAATIAAAALLALGAGEMSLARMALRPAEWLFPDEEPRRLPDARLGWTFVPARTGHRTIGGRDVAYTFDANGYRVRSPAEPVDLDRPTMIFAGESVMVGEGLTWDESIPAQVGAIVGVQSANLAVHGFTTDQAYMRLHAELPRFRKPVAIVTLFMPALLGRNIDDDRPHLEPGLAWVPARQQARLTSLAQIIVPYRSDGAIDRGIRKTRDIFRAVETLARSQGATPLVVVPQFGRDARDEELQRRIFERSGVSYVVVEIDPAWRIPWDRHPDARAARVIAGAVAARLK